MIDLFGRRRIATLLEELQVTKGELAEERNYCRRLVERAADDIRPLILALGRMIAQKDKYFVMDELDPARKAESDAIGEAVIKRLMSEDAARRKTVP